MSTSRSLRVADLVSSPANFFALGAGCGLAPKAPGTVGTLLGIPLLLLMPTDPLRYIVMLLILFAFGVWCCGASATRLGVHDHPGIVWDEIVGYLVVMFAVPRSAWFLLAGFVLFRFFDILKPWPIGAVDRQLQGGLGIMLDDVLAGVYAALVLQILVWLLAS